MSTWWVAASTAAAVAWALPPCARWPAPRTGRGPEQGVIRDDRLHRWRWMWSLLAGTGGAAFVSGRLALPIGAVTALAVWVWVGRAEPGSVRRRREAVARELPGLVQLLVGALESGCDVAAALSLVCTALPGPAADLLSGVARRLSLGVAPEHAWATVASDPELAALGRAMNRASRSGSSVTQEVARLADDLDRRARLRIEERARAVGVKAAVPLGLCLLPSFLLIGVVPLVAALLRSLSL